jgi:mycobactin peptide synthetase MbtE
MRDLGNDPERPVTVPLTALPAAAPRHGLLPESEANPCGPRSGHGTCRDRTRRTPQSAAVRGAAGHAAHDVLPGPAGDPQGLLGTPLTPVQARFLTRHLLDPDDLSVHCVLLWKIEGRLGLRALADAVADLHERHEALRAAYLFDPDPVARPCDAPAPVLEVLPAETDLGSAVAMLRESFLDPLSLAEGEVWRTAVVSVSHDAWVFGLVVHRVAFDERSASVLADELSAAYTGRVRGSSLSKPATASMADRHAARRAVLPGWIADPWTGEPPTEELHDIPEIRWPAVPGTFAEALSGQSALACLEAVVDRPAVERLDAAADHADVSRSTVLLSSFGQALAAVTGRRDVIVGLSVAPRPDARFDEAIGCHIDLAYARVQAVTPAQRHTAGTAASFPGPGLRNVPPAEPVRMTGPSGWSAALQASFTLQDAPPPTLSLDGARCTPVPLPRLTLPVEIQAEARILTDGCLRLAVTFRSDVIPFARAHALLTRLVERIAAGP